MLTAAQRIQGSSGAFTAHQNQALAKILTNVPGVAYRAAPLVNNSIASNTLIDLMHFSIDGKNAVTGVIARFFASGQYTAPTAAAGDVQPRFSVTAPSATFLQPFPHLAPLASASGASQAWEMHAHVYIQPVTASTISPSLQSNQSGQPFYPQGNAGQFTVELKFNMSTQTNASAAANNVGNQQDSTLSLLYKSKNPVNFILGQTLDMDLAIQVKGVSFQMDIGYAEIL